MVLKSDREYSKNEAKPFSACKTPFPSSFVMEWTVVTVNDSHNGKIPRYRRLFCSHVKCLCLKQVIYASNDKSFIT